MNSDNTAFQDPYQNSVSRHAILQTLQLRRKVDINDQEFSFDDCHTYIGFPRARKKIPPQKASKTKSIPTPTSTPPIPILLNYPYEEPEN